MHESEGNLKQQDFDAGLIHPVKTGQPVKGYSLQ